MTAVEEALDKEFDRAYDIWGGDIDPRAIDIARAMPKRQRWKTPSALKSMTPAGSRKSTDALRPVVTNPPYGERLMEKQEVSKLYGEFRPRSAPAAGGVEGVHPVQSHGI